MFSSQRRLPRYVRYHVQPSLIVESDLTVKTAAGEAQKIDRIMEKFAERYCLDNEGAFASADGPYLLAFALIMLNTDAHNPRAEKKLSSEDFVNMCQAQVRLPPYFNLHKAASQVKSSRHLAIG